MLVFLDMVAEEPTLSSPPPEMKRLHEPETTRHKQVNTRFGVRVTKLPETCERGYEYAD